MSERRPWRRALVWMVLLGIFFFSSYGFANWLASRRSSVGAVAFNWEHRIPFLPWTIVPYWSIDLLYGLSLLVCSTRAELDRHAQRLLTVQLVCIAFFIAVPLRFSFDRPVAHGFFGALFTALFSFDKPFNQAPSLHIALLVLIWTLLTRHCSPRWRPALHAWMTLIGLSVLTTYQHHFIDLPSGMAVGLLALWLLPDTAPSPLARLSISPDRRRRRLAARYAIGGLLLAAVACAGGAWLWLFWPAFSLGLVALNYLAIGAQGFQKGTDGRLSIGARGLLSPYLACAWINSRLWTRRHPLPAEVVDGVSIGRIPGWRQGGMFAAIVDLSAELSCAAGSELLYRSIPVLDLTTPGATSLRAAAQAIEEARQRGPVLVCCALGYSRSAAAIVAWLLTTHRAGDVAEAIRMVQAARPAIVLERDHCAALEAFA